jgi:hypothetical protein
MRRALTIRPGKRARKRKLGEGAEPSQARGASRTWRKRDKKIEILGLPVEHQNDNRIKR